MCVDNAYYSPCTNPGCAAGSSFSIWKCEKGWKVTEKKRSFMEQGRKSGQYLLGKKLKDWWSRFQQPRRVIIAWHNQTWVEVAWVAWQPQVRNCWQWSWDSPFSAWSGKWWAAEVCFSWGPGPSWESHHPAPWSSDGNTPVSAPWRSQIHPLRPTFQGPQWGALRWVWSELQCYGPLYDAQRLGSCFAASEKCTGSSCSDRGPHPHL